MDNNEDLKLAAQDAVKEGKSEQQFLQTIAPSFRNTAQRFYDQAEKAPQTLTYQELAKKIKAMFGWNYRVNGPNIYFTVKGEVDEKALMAYLTGFFSNTPIRPRLHRNPHYRTVVYSTPFYLNLYILH